MEQPASIEQPLAGTPRVAKIEIEYRIYSNKRPTSKLISSHLK